MPADAYPAQRALLRRLFDAAVAAADPQRCLADFLPPLPAGRLVVVGAGKAAAAMARAVETHWADRLDALQGCVVTRHGHAVPCARIDVVEAGHPLPDAAGEAAARRILRMVGGLSEDDLVLVLLSGGGSALLTLPAPGIALADKQATTRALLASGATIREINCVRKHLSAIKGGRLAMAAWPARVLTLALSDVPGDDLSTIASGPTVADATTCDDALEVLDRYGIAAPYAVRAALLRGETETPKTGDARLGTGAAQVVAGGAAALAAAAEAARAAGITPLVLGDAIEGEAREVARAIGGMAVSCALSGTPVEPPCVLLSGGETTVSVRGTGRGGRNSEFLLALGAYLDAYPQVQRRIHALAADTDGIDGTEDNAGAFWFPDSPARARAAGADIRAHLAMNDAYGYFAGIDDLLVTGPTHTNVNDFRAVLIERRD